MSSCAPLLPLPYPLVRPDNATLMHDLFKRLYDKAIKETGGSVEWSKALMGRGSAGTTVVEGFYSIADGVQIMHMFLLRPEGPGDVADMLLFCKVSGERYLYVGGRLRYMSITHDSKKPYSPISLSKAARSSTPVYVSEWSLGFRRL